MPYRSVLEFKARILAWVTAWVAVFMMADDQQDLCLAVGMKFSSYNTLETAIKSYQEANFCQLWKRDCRTLAVHKKRGYLTGKEQTVNEDLKYAYVNFSCVFGGRKYSSRNTGKRTNTR